MATLAIVGALAVFVALGLPNDTAEAQGVETAPVLPTITVGNEVAMTGTLAGNQSITVVWGHDAGAGATATGFEIEYLGQAESGNNPNILGTEEWPNAKSISTGPGDRGWKIPDLDNAGIEYFVRMRAVNGAAKSAWTAIHPTGDDGINPTPGAPAMPMVSVTQTGTGEITASWMPGADGGSEITGYVAQIRRAAGQRADFDGTGSDPVETKAAASDWIPTTDSGGFTTVNQGLPINLGELMTLSADTRTRTFGSLLEGVKYEVQVFALNSAQTASATVDSGELTALTNEGTADATLGRCP